MGGRSGKLVLNVENWPSIYIRHFVNAFGSRITKFSQFFWTESTKAVRSARESVLRIVPGPIGACHARRVKKVRFGLRRSAELALQAGAVNFCIRRLESRRTGWYPGDLNAAREVAPA